jgi:hypothetical protein
MYAAEIIVREVQSASRFQVPQPLRESVSQPSESAHLHSHGQVLPFDMAGADAGRVRVTGSHLGYNLNDWRWGVFCICVMLPILAIQLD